MSDTPPIAAAPAAAPAKTPPFSTRDVLAVMSTLLFVAAYFAPWVHGMPKGADQYLGQMQGAVTVQWALVMGWYFGSSRDSAVKTATAAVQAETIAAMTPKADQ